MIKFLINHPAGNDHAGGRVDARIPGSGVVPGGGCRPIVERAMMPAKIHTEILSGICLEVRAELHKVRQMLCSRSLMTGPVLPAPPREKIRATG
jgi:hypothetical protein